MSNIEKLQEAASRLKQLERQAASEILKENPQIENAILLYKDNETGRFTYKHILQVYALDARYPNTVVICIANVITLYATCHCRTGVFISIPLSDFTTHKTSRKEYDKAIHCVMESLKFPQLRIMGEDFASTLDYTQSNIDKHFKSGKYYFPKDKVYSVAAPSNIDLHPETDFPPVVVEPQPDTAK